MTRLLSALAGLGLALGGTLPALAQGELNLLTWEGYADPSFIEPFTAKTGCTVTATYVGSGDEIVAKMLGGGADTYDLVTPASDIPIILINAGVVEALDMSKIPNAANLAPGFQAPSFLMKDGEQYGTPYTYGIFRIWVDADAVQPVPTDLSFFDDPKLQGKLTLWDDIDAIFTIGRALGIKDVYQMSDAELEQVKQRLLQLKPMIRKYWFAAGELDELIAAKEVVGGNTWEQSLAAAWKAGRNLVEVPHPGGNGGFTDNWLVTKGSLDNPCVYPFLDHMLSPEAQAAGFKITSFGYTNPGMKALLSPEESALYDRLYDPARLPSVDWLRPVKNRQKYLEVWNQVKAAQ